jgi:hypothetical protein
MEIKPFFSVLIVLAVLAAVGVFIYTGVGPPIPGQALPQEGLPEQGPRMGMLRLYLCDAPLDAENITGVYITIDEIQYHGDGQWTTCQDFVGPETYDLLELTGGNSALLGELALPAGHYTQIRFMLDIEEEGSSRAGLGCYLEFADSSTVPLYAPSGGRTGYKGVGDFEVPVNGTIEVTADFDASKAVVVAGSRYILKPTIKLVVSH